MYLYIYIYKDKFLYFEPSAKELYNSFSESTKIKDKTYMIYKMTHEAYEDYNFIVHYIYLTD